MFREERFGNGGVSLNVRVSTTNGPPLLMLHGILRRADDFATLWPGLLPDWKIHAIDHRGHGSSDRAADYRVIDYSDDAIARLDALDQPAFLFGHSLGALAAVRVAALRPGLIRAVILEDPPAPSFLRSLPELYRSLWGAMQALAGRTDPIAELTRELAAVELPQPDGRRIPLGELRDPTSLRYSAACLRDVDPEVLTPVLQGRWLDGYDVEACWSGVRCPLLLLRGDERLGGMLDPREVRRLVSLCADGILIDIPNVGHLLHWQAAETTLRYSLGFFQAMLSSR